MKYKHKKTGELTLFQSIWTTRPHKSFVSELPIREFSVWCFAHVLNKNVYPDQRLNENNIVLLLPHEHFMLDHGTQKDREAYAQKNQSCDWSRIDELKDELRSNLR